MTKLMIVESPKKAKKIQTYMGSDWVVKASFGHIRDLPEKEMGVDLANFTPQYVVTAKSKSNLAVLRSLSQSAEQVYLATDPDREGPVCRACERGIRRRLHQGTHQGGGRRDWSTGPTGHACPPRNEQRSETRP